MKKIIRRKYNFIQGWGTYNIESFISIGTNYQELLKAMERMGLKKENIAFLKKGKEEILKRMGDPAMFCSFPSGNILWVREYRENDWEFFEYLVHEIFHAVYLELGKKNGMLKEDEAMAYQIEFLFREIRRKIYKHHYGKN